MRLVSHPAPALRGEARVPPDKSISHRALILGAMARGDTTIANLLEGDDVLRTAAALRALGAQIERAGGRWTVTGGAWSAPRRPLYLGNSGTGARLLMGAAAGRGIPCAFMGDESLSGRPMGRITDPLERMGAKTASRGGRMPVALEASALRGIDYTLPKPSAQVKSAVLLAGLGADGTTTVTEPVPVRDHTERMLAGFGAPPIIEDLDDGGKRIAVQGGTPLTPASIDVPADPSSAAFPVVAALVRSGTHVTLPGVLANPRRTGLFTVLRRMGGVIEETGVRNTGGEVVCDLTVRGGALRATHVSADEVPDMIDEVPILCVAAAFAHGLTRIEGLEELRVKESDRLAATFDMLAANGVLVTKGRDWIEVTGGIVLGGGEVRAQHDHRIAMAAAVLGTGAQAPVTVDGADAIATSFPGFTALMNELGARIAH